MGSQRTGYDLRLNNNNDSLICFCDTLDVFKGCSRGCPVLPAAALASLLDHMRRGKGPPVPLATEPRRRSRLPGIHPWDSLSFPCPSPVDWTESSLWAATCK